ncbi:type II CAAX endopeptidase family protein [Draconibacterium orientale]|uniref:CPBP family intramembrane glutamic endopeptidase n=1 Tax=Draconibacterium orientale TaxID=1168034 RepID=UPI002A0A3057|nr:type II CAAX endopeptidase family protein [Draconibacterium orientale]
MLNMSAHTLARNKFTSIGIFLALTFVLSAIYYSLIICSGTLGSGWGQFTMGLMWCPGISALITLKILKRDFADLGWKWGKTKYQIRSYLLPLLYTFIAYLLIWIFGWGEFYNKEFVVKLSNSFGFGEIGDGLVIACYVLLFGIFGTIRSASSALGEEIGWRGFLVSELYPNLGYTKTSLISGVVWGVWHLPILLFADYNSGTPLWYAMTCFMVLIISMSFIYTWFRIKSGSLWTAVLLHASHNLFIQNIFTPLTQDTGNTAYYIDEFGIVLPMVSVGFAIYYWSKQNELHSLEEKV